MNTVLIFTLLFGLAVPALAQQSTGDDASQKGPFIHTVYFWLNNPDSEADQQRLLEGLNKLKQIDLIHQGYVGVPAPTNREVIDSSYDYSITFIFKTMEDEQAYQKHPSHLEFVEEYGDLWDRVIVYDALPPSE